MDRTRMIAVELAKLGTIVIEQKRKVLDPTQEFRGIFRLRWNELK